MSFLAELSKRQGKQPSQSVKPFGFARALHLDTTATSTDAASLLPPFLEKKTSSQTFASPFAKSAIEILKELERKAEEDASARQQHPEDDPPNGIKPHVPSAGVMSSSLMSSLNRRTLNATVLGTPAASSNDNQSDNDFAAPPDQAIARPVANPAKNVLEEMMKARRAPPPQEPAPTQPAKSSGKNAMLEQLLQKRNKSPEIESSPSSNNNEEEGPKKHNMLAQLLQKRNSAHQPPLEQPSPTSSSASTESSESTRSSEDSTADVPLKDHPKYATYFLMLKRGLPKPAVQHRMTKENVDPAILDMDPNQPLIEYTLATDPVYEKYFKMLKTGLPRPVVEHKLRADGISPHLLDLDPTIPTVPKAQLDAAFEAHKEKVVAKYKKMLKLGMPPMAVDHAMVKDNVDPSWLHPESTATATSSKSFMTRKVAKPDRIRKKLHWVVLNKDAMDASTLWKQPTQAALSDASVAALERLFTKSIHDDVAKAHKSDVSNTAKSTRDLLQVKSVSLMDMKKAQNIGITLARIKVPFEYVARSHVGMTWFGCVCSKIKDEILNMNPTVMSSMHLKALIDLWPDAQEMKAIRDFQGDPQTLGLAERFCHVMRDTPRFPEKLQCLIFKQEFHSRSHELRETILLIVRCVHQICTSDDLRDILLLVLKMGNVLNFGKDAENGAAGVAKGFSLSSLVKLSQTKAFVGQTTLLQFLVEVVDRDAPHLAQFDEEVGLLERASRVVTQQLYMEKKALEGGRAHLEAEAQRILGEDHETNLTAAAIRFFLTKVDMELRDLTDQLDSLNQKKASFLRYIGEEGNYEVDELFSVLWAFTEEFRAAHRKFVLKKARAAKKKQPPPPPVAECA
ncbi:hypothetical protein H310_02424 [Aphanomyces invadans]|uniref:FH2 domain-containing protein n=1 Tax=Aphanomyces invadans TaxID=157072 RepID=A0A024UPE9_9STRA|nr:hypothetical protein H310_02424 [Aphanomyces invadans]ETW08055.1 hypothetical protein H310_02424 [Aphanomyces invadans]|eukprot:XP_008864148.1 hypothetical protein H310_02424 [Aphanomyces invadans]